jgi:hypothetical protein
MKNKRTRLTRDPLELHGLPQAIFILEHLCKGKSEDELIEQLDGDRQLVDMWVNFLVHNHWIVNDGSSDGWIITGKGRRWIETITAVSMKTSLDSLRD